MRKLFFNFLFSNKKATYTVLIWIAAFLLLLIVVTIFVMHTLVPMFGG
jgi:hypothetical protein